MYICDEAVEFVVNEEPKRLESYRWMEQFDCDVLEKVGRWVGCGVGSIGVQYANKPIQFT